MRQNQQKMKQPIISGIQQMGIGIPAVYDAWAFYRKAFQMDIPIFDEAAEANLMLPYTGGEARERHAVLALSAQGGGGMEIWQYTSRVPQPPSFEIKTGDIGLFICKMKTLDVRAAYQDMKSKGLDVLGELSEMPDGKEHFFVKDPYGNIFEVVPTTNNFRKTSAKTGGVFGSIIGVTDVDKSAKFYGDIMGYDTVVYDETAVFEDFASLPGGDVKVRRVLLRHSKPRRGSFSNMLGESEIELIQVIEGHTPRKIFKDRMWGDLGFIHLCFDIRDMDAMRQLCAAKACPFTVDSQSDREVFDMGEAAGNFSYIEDPDGALIEFVEAFKIPILKKIGWYLDLRKRNPEKALPNWMLKALALNRVKD